MQQRFGSDVAVQQRGYASELGQSEPDQYKQWFIAHKNGHCVTLLQEGMLGQSSGHSVAFSVSLDVRE